MIRVVIPLDKLNVQDFNKNLATGHRDLKHVQTCVEKSYRQIVRQYKYHKFMQYENQIVAKPIPALFRLQFF
jgi:hypothetical protein